METKKTAGLSLFWTFILFIVLSGYVVYGDFKSVATLGLMALIGGFAATAALLPGIGIYLQHILMTKIINGLAATPGMKLTWVTSTIYWYFMVLGIILNLVIILIIIAAFFYKRKSNLSLKEKYKEIINIKQK